MTSTVTAIDNPYWEAVRDRTKDSRIRGGVAVDDLTSRRELVDEYAWAISDPETVAFVAEHCGPRVVDPIAGSGYWPYLLAQTGADVVAYDVNPPDASRNHWHQSGRTHFPVTNADGVKAVALHPDRTLFLSWPCYDDPSGVDVVRAYAGNRVVYIGEGMGGCNGDDAMFAEFASNWRVGAAHRPVQWAGIHDYVQVYDRI